MKKLEESIDFMNQVIEQNEQMRQLLESFDERLIEVDETIKECDELLQDVLHMSEYFHEKEPTDDEYATIGRKVSELRTRRRDAKKARYVLEQNRKVIKGLAPAVSTAESKIAEPSSLGNPTYHMYRLRNDKTLELVEQLPSFDMTSPVQILKKYEGRDGSNPDFFKPKEEEDQAEVPESKPKEDPPIHLEVKPMNVVKREGQKYIVRHDEEIVFSAENFVEIIVHLTKEQDSSETQFVGKVYKSFQTFAKTFRAGKHRSAFEVNPVAFEKLAANSYCG